MAIMVTGGAGFIGSHTCVELLESGREVVVVDDFSNSHPGALSAVRDLAGRDLTVHVVDLRDSAALDEVFDAHDIDSVIHFAAKKAVGESMQIPFDYLDVNVAGTISLLRAMASHGVGRLVFSSSCSIYGAKYDRPITEDDEPGPTNPYARSKLICEQIIQQICDVVPGFTAISLRYFNPAGAHPSGMIGEVPRGVPGNVMPLMMAVAAGRQPALRVFGDDYDTPDGTGIRDYIHVVDVARAHTVALDHLEDAPGTMTVLNLGTGSGLSVLDLVRTFERTCEVQVPYEVTPRRPGDVPRLVADATRVEKEWGWRTTLDAAAMCADAWRFEQDHPGGYGG